MLLIKTSAFPKMNGCRCYPLFVHKAWCIGTYTMHFETIVAEYVVQVCSGQIRTTSVPGCRVTDTLNLYPIHNCLLFLNIGFIGLPKEDPL